MPTLNQSGPEAERNQSGTEATSQTINALYIRAPPRIVVCANPPHSRVTTTQNFSNDIDNEIDSH